MQVGSFTSPDISEALAKTPADEIFFNARVFETIDPTFFFNGVETTALTLFLGKYFSFLVLELLLFLAFYSSKKKRIRVTRIAEESIFDMGL